MSSSSLNAPIAINVICQCLSPHDFAGIEWRRGDGVVIQADNPDQRTAMAERLGLTDHRVSRDGSIAYAEGEYADVPVSIYSGPSFDEVKAWALDRAVTA